MPKPSTSKLYQRTKALLTPPSSPPSALALNSKPLESSPASNMTKRSNASSSTTTTFVEQPGPDGRVVQVPKSEWKQPRKIGFFESWYIFYEGMFAGSMLETVGCPPTPLLLTSSSTDHELSPLCSGRKSYFVCSSFLLLRAKESYLTLSRVIADSILVLFLTLLALAASYLPGHLRQIASHARYYAYGTGEYSPR